MPLLCLFRVRFSSHLNLHLFQDFESCFFRSCLFFFSFSCCCCCYGCCCCFSFSFALFGAVHCWFALDIEIMFYFKHQNVMRIWWSRFHSQPQSRTISWCATQQKANGIAVWNKKPKPNTISSNVFISNPRLQREKEKLRVECRMGKLEKVSFARSRMKSYAQTMTLY